MLFFKILTRRRPPACQYPLGESKNSRKPSRAKKRCCFQDPDPLEATCMLIPYFGRQKKHRKNRNNKGDAIFQNPDPPEATVSRNPRLGMSDIKESCEIYQRASFFKILTCQKPMAPEIPNFGGPGPMSPGPTGHGPKTWAS